MSKIDKNHLGPKVLFLDIETAPLKAFIWRTGKQVVNHTAILPGEQSKIICAAYRWEHEKRAKCLVWNNKKQDCSKLVDDLSKLVEEADIVIGHNADSFDIKHINTQRMLAGQPPIAWPTTEDTLKQIRQQFALPSYRLDYICTLLLGEGKTPMNFDDWKQISLNKCEKSLRKMVKYCKRDVDIMAEAYTKLKPYLKVKANRALIQDKPKTNCPQCGSDSSLSRGIRTLLAGRYRIRRCKACGHTFKGEKV